VTTDQLPYYPTSWKSCIGSPKQGNTFQDPQQFAYRPGFGVKGARIAQWNWASWFNFFFFFLSAEYIFCIIHYNLFALFYKTFSLLAHLYTYQVYLAIPSYLRRWEPSESSEVVEQAHADEWEKIFL